MTLRGLLNEVLNKGELLVTFNIIYLEYYENVEYLSDKTIDDIIGSYTSVCRELLELGISDDMYTNNLKINVKESIDDMVSEEPYIDVGLYDKKADKVYAIDFTPWDQLIDTEVYSLVDLDDSSLLAHILWEITFYGYSNEKVVAEKNRLDKLLEDIDNGTAELIPFPGLSGMSVDDLLD